MTVQFKIDRKLIEEFCRKWKVKEFSIFGSALRDDFRPESDVDVLFELEEDAHWSLLDHIHAEEELGEMFGRKVDLVRKRAVRNPFRRHHILNNREVIYVS